MFCLNFLEENIFLWSDFYLIFIGNDQVILSTNSKKETMGSLSLGYLFRCWIWSVGKVV